MIPPTSIDGTDITGATIDGTDVQEITVDGQTVFSAGPPVIESHEDGDLSRFTGDTSQFTVQNGTVFDGSFAVEGSGSGLIYTNTRTIERGKRYRTYIYLPSGSRGGQILFMGSGTNACYSILTNPNASENRACELVEFDPNFTVIGPSSGTQPPFDQWNYFEIETTATTITAELYDGATDTVTASAAATSSKFSDGGLGYRNFSQPAFYDFWISPL